MSSVEQPPAEKAGTEVASSVEITPQDEPRLASVRSVAVISCACLAMILNASSIQALVIAIPNIQRDLDINGASLQWLVTAYALTSGCFLLLFGRLADIFGRKPVFIIGALWYIAFSIGCGFAQSGMVLIILRALTGMGGATIIPAAIGILANTFPPSQARTVAFSMFQAGAPTGGAIGLIIGGLTTEYAAIGWRALFFISAGVGVLVVILALIYFPSHHVYPTDKRVDWLGALFITTSLVLLVFCLGQGQIAPEGWNTPYIIALLILAILSFIAFVFWERYVGAHLTLPPLIRLGIFKRGNGKLSAVLLVAFLVMGAFSSWQYWATLYYQDYVLLPPVQTMIRFIPMNVVGISMNVLFAFVAAHVSGHTLLVCGCCGTAAAGILFALIQPEATYWAFGFPGAILDVCGADITMAGGALFVAKVAMLEEQSLAGGVFNTVITLGVSFTTTITTIVYDRAVNSEMSREGLTLNAEGSNASFTALLTAYRQAFWTCFAFATFAALVAFIFLRGIGVIGTKARPKGEMAQQAGVEMGAIASKEDDEKVEEPVPIVAMELD